MQTECKLNKGKQNAKNLYFSGSYWLKSPEPIGFSTVITSFWTVFEEAGNLIVRRTEQATIIK